MVKRDDVDAVRLDNHSVLDFINRCPCIAPDLVGEDAFVILAGACTRIKAMPDLMSEGMAEKNFSNAASPPADAPIPTMGKSFFGGLFEFASGEGCSLTEDLKITFDPEA